MNWQLSLFLCFVVSLYQYHSFCPGSNNKNRKHLKTSYVFLSQDVFFFAEYIRFNR